MDTLEYLQKLGWNISSEGYKLLTNDDNLKDLQAIIRNACDTDIKEFGNAVLSKDTETFIKGPIVLQIQKLRNISSPKSNENSNVAPRLIKLILTDGHSTCQAIEYELITNLNISKTPPGTKIVIKNAQIVGSYILLTNSNANIIGGNVTVLIERWQLSKSITKHVREGFDGPPSWVPFGQKLITSVVTDKNFKSLDTGKKESTKDEFEVQREEAIAEASAHQGAVRKTFGGGTQKQIYTKPINIKRQSDKRPKTDSKKKLREKETTEVQKPSGKISLFAFLEDKLPTETITNKSTIQIQKKDLVKPTYAEKYDATLRHQDKARVPNEKAPRFQRQHQNQNNTTAINNLIKRTNDMSINTSNKNRNYYEQNLSQNVYGMKYSNNFNSISNERQQNEAAIKYSVSQPTEWKWKVGDQCMAKYWEDNQFYNASITGITPRTCMVRFNDYGNFEEVLKVDCLPLVTNDIQTNNVNMNSNRQTSGSLIFRRGGNGVQAKSTERFNQDYRRKY